MNNNNNNYYYYFNNNNKSCRWINFFFLLLLLLLTNNDIHAFVISPSTSTSIRRSSDFKTTFRHQQQHYLSSLSPIITFEEPSTNTTVKIIGTMHYNPSSIEMVRNVINELGQQNRLASVCIESCDIRWLSGSEVQKQKNNKKEETKENDWLYHLLESEMRVACNTSLSYQRPTILADQRINITLNKMKNGFLETIRDICRGPFTTSNEEGWNHVYQTFERALPDALPTNNQNDEKTLLLPPWVLMNPSLLMAAPVTFFKYPLSFFVRKPLTFFGIVTFFTLVLYYDNMNTAQSSSSLLLSDDATFFSFSWEEITSLILYFFQLIVMGRVFIKELLADRNHVLAQSILTQCQIYSTTTTITTTTSLNQEQEEEQESATNEEEGNMIEQNHSISLVPQRELTDDNFSNSNVIMELRSPNVVAVPSKNPVTGAKLVYMTPNQSIFLQSKQQMEKEKEIVPKKTVVAVMGMAHVNGVVQLLKEQRINIQPVVIQQENKET